MCSTLSIMLTTWVTTDIILSQLIITSTLPIAGLSSQGSAPHYEKEKKRRNNKTIKIPKS